jgi:cell division protein FtsL
MAERKAKLRQRIPWGIKTFALTFGFVGILTGLGIYQVWQQYEVYSLGVELSHETLSYRALLDNNRRLRLERATLKRGERVRKEATERMGMRIPMPHQVVEIR